MLSFTVKKYTFENLTQTGTWTTLACFALPFTDGESLDESLDAGKLMLSLMDESYGIGGYKKAFKPWTRIRIEITDGTEDDEGNLVTEVIDRVVMSDVSKCARFDSA